MLRASTIRNAAQITNIGTLMKQAGILCVKCLDTKKLWTPRNQRNNDGRGRFYVIECTDCSAGGIINTCHSLPDKEDGKTIYESTNNNIQERMKDLEIIIKQKEEERLKWEQNENRIRRKETVKALPSNVSDGKDGKDVIKQKVETPESILIEMNQPEPVWRRYSEVIFEFPFEMTRDEMISQIVERDEIRVEIDGFNMKDHLLSQFIIVPHQSVQKIGEENLYVLFKSEEVTDRSKSPWFICGCSWKNATTIRNVTIRIMQPKNVAAFTLCDVDRQRYNRQLSCIVPVTVEKYNKEEEKKEAEKEKK
jgi:hypothetical protein